MPKDEILSRVKAALSELQEIEKKSTLRAEADTYFLDRLLLDYKDGKI
jgi:hypothetical protein